MLDDPYAHYALLRETDPVHYADQIGRWILKRHDDVERILRDPRFSSVITFDAAAATGVRCGTRTPSATSAWSSPTRPATPGCGAW
ncbi:hypothetical protein SUDANB1_00098 [Streptomyces sp. enrichment culture]|uniref:hypothetical protein n=1 Tax=Streptomyces sp. enrichment culture TaxID=1795815 RepID=UPI003F57FEAD